MQTDIVNSQNESNSYTSEFIVQSLQIIFNNKLNTILAEISNEFNIDKQKLDKFLDKTKTELDLSLPSTKQKRKKNKQLSKDKLCMARKADGHQCTRRRKDGTEFCGKHSNNLKFGRIDDEDKLSKNDNFIKCSAIQINGKDYLIDDNKIVYSYNIDVPTIIGGLDENGQLIKT